MPLPSLSSSAQLALPATEEQKGEMKTLSKSLSTSTFPHFNSCLKQVGANYLFYDFSNSTTPSKVLLTCEHASNALPPPYTFTASAYPADFATSHWTFDPHAAEFSLELAKQLACPVVLSRYSRLFIDVNRPLTSDTLFRKECLFEAEVKKQGDDAPATNVEVDFNNSGQLTEAEQKRRVMEYYLPYYFKLREVAEQKEAQILMSIHSFNRLYEGTPRAVETGVLFSTDDGLAKKFYDQIHDKVYGELGTSDRTQLVRLNEPWSGRDGIMHAIDSLRFATSSTADITGKAVRRQSVMFEFRNDKLADKKWREKMISDGLVPVLDHVLHTPLSTSSSL